MDCIVHGVAKSRRQLGDFHFTLLKVKAIKVNRALDFERKECLFIDFSKNHTGILEYVLGLSLYMTLRIHGIQICRKAFENMYKYI